MAESSLSRDEIEKDIKRLINFGCSDDKKSNVEIKQKASGNHRDQKKFPVAAKDNNTQNPDQGSRKGKKKDKSEHNEEGQVSSGKRRNRKKHQNQKKGLEEIQDGVVKLSLENPDLPKSNSDETGQCASPRSSLPSEALKPGLIISVNENSKRSIVSYLSSEVGIEPKTGDVHRAGDESQGSHENKAGVKTKGSQDKKASVESPRESPVRHQPSKIDNESKEKDDHNQKQKKKKKKGKKDKGDSGSDEEPAEARHSGQKYSKAQIEAFAAQFWKRDKCSEEKDTKKDKKGDELPTDLICQILELDRIFPLKKKSVRFPRARYFCRVCDYHMDTHEDVQRHGKDHRHQRRVENINTQDELRRLADPSTEHISSLDVLLEETYKAHSLSEEMLMERKQTVEKLELFLKKLIPDIKLQMFGSTYTGLGLVTSDVNVDLEVKEGHAVCLTQAFAAMKESGDYENVISDFASKVPCIYFTVKDVNYRLTISNDSARNTSRLLKLYSECDPRFKKLAVVFRYWAKVCKVDRQDEGTLPAYSFNLLLVFYLQRCKPPVLPLLYQGSEDTEASSPTKNKIPFKTEVVDFEEMTELASSWKSENTSSIGDLWLNLFKYFVLGFEVTSHVICIRRLTACTRAEKKWNSKKLAIEDPFSVKRNVTRSVIGFELFEYIWDCIQKAYRYFGQPTNCKRLKKKKKRKLPEVDDKESSVPVIDKEDVNSANNVKGVGSDDGNLQPKVSNSSRVDGTSGPDSLTQVVNISAESNDKKSAVCDNDLKAEHSMYGVAKNFVDSIIEAAVKSIKSSHDVHSLQDHESPEVTDQLVKSDICSSGVHSIQDQERSEVTDQGVNSEMCTAVINDKINDHESKLSSSDKVQNKSLESNSEQKHHNSELSCEEVEISGIKNDGQVEYNHSFQFSSLTDGKGPAIYCSSCEKEGHLKHSCPDEKLPDLTELPKFTQSHKEMLNLVLKRMPREFGPSELELRRREQIRCEFEDFIREQYPDAKVHLFGSSHNGFGFSQSDLDLCVTLDSHKTGEGLNMVSYIEEIAAKLKTHRGLYNVFPITTAKVPIIKFKHRGSQLEGDISMYNLLAIHNTKMVRMYAAIDPRVRVLGYALKVFAKICDIGDASRGSLSSYAYVLMLLHYLQQCKPPVIPVLQELYKFYGPEKPELIVDGWNVWFFDNIDTLPKVWLDYGKNNQSVAELWLGFFRYYTEEFNMKEQVVCCRQTKMLTKFEKLWNSACIAIEDPFDLNHNLGSGLSRKMQQFIHKALIRGRVLYGNPRPDLTMDPKLVYGYFFSSDYLTSDGPAPNDRCCRACNKIGHIAKECPVVKNRKQREEKDRVRKIDQRAREDDKPYSPSPHRNNANNNNPRRDRQNPPQDPQAGHRRGMEQHHQHRQTTPHEIHHERVIHRTTSESSPYYGKPMMIPESQHHTQRSMSVPTSVHHGYYQMSQGGSPQQGYQQQHMNQMHHNLQPRSYHQGSPNAGINRALFNQQQRLPSGQSPPVSAGHQKMRRQWNNDQSKRNNSYTENYQDGHPQQQRFPKDSLIGQAEQYYYGKRH